MARRRKQPLSSWKIPRRTCTICNAKRAMYKALWCIHCAMMGAQHTQAGVDAWLDQPASTELKRAFTAEALEREMTAKLTLLRRLISPDESVMLDVDQVAMGVVAEVFSRITSTGVSKDKLDEIAETARDAAERKSLERAACAAANVAQAGMDFGEANAVCMDAAVRWAEANGEEQAVVRASRKPPKRRKPKRRRKPRQQSMFGPS